VSALLCPTLPCPALLCTSFASYHAMSSFLYYVMPCSLLPGLQLCYILTHSTSHCLPRHTIESQPSHSYAPARLVLTLPYPTLLCLTLPYLTLPYLTLPYLALPGIILWDIRQSSPSNLHLPSNHPIYLHLSSSIYHPAKKIPEPEDDEAPYDTTYKEDLPVKGKNAQPKVPSIRCYVM
jgi:hypothetical protein